MTATTANAAEAYFFLVFMSDLVPHQDDATTGEEITDAARAVVVWYNQNAPDDNLIKTADVPAFLAWMDSNRAEIAEHAASARAL
tara:strand:+ start:4188 stop:4442 length:255 start_codon:yes stop_codon:yes gene_type:complete